MKFSFNMWWHRSSKPKLGSCLSVGNITKTKTKTSKHTPGGLTHVDLQFITHIPGAGTDGGGQCEAERTSSSLRLVISVPEKGGTRPTGDAKAHYLSV